MSNSDSYASTALTDAEKVTVRRYCYYPSFGTGNVADFQGYRFFTSYGTLEYRMTNMGPEELQVVRMYLAMIGPLELALPAASAGLNVAAASVFTRNPRELIERRRLLDYHRTELCNFMGIPPGPMKKAAGAIVI